MAVAASSSPATRGGLREGDRGILPPLLLAAGIAAFLAACFLARPIGVTIVDEVNYFTEAWAIWHRLPLDIAGSYPLANGVIPFHGPLYPAGWPTLLAPFTSLPWPWPFALAPTFHILGTVVLAAVFKKRGLSPAWGLLYLAQPTLLAFSRTLMAEPVAAFQVALFLLLAETENAFLLGLVAGFAPLIKLSQALVAAPFVAVWLWKRPVTSRPRDSLKAVAGSAVGLGAFLWFNQLAYGHWLATGYGANYAAPARALIGLGLGLAQLSVAWPLLPLGLLRSRAEEAAGALTALLYLAVYGYHYVGTGIVATLIVGARLHSSAIVLLLPGYAILLTQLGSLGKTIRTWGPVALDLVAIATPFVILPAVSERRQQLESLRTEMLEHLRPDCITGYSKPALKLLLPLPYGKILRGPEDIARLDRALTYGACVDVIDPLSEPSTYQHPPIYPDAFESLVQAWPNRDMTPPDGVRVLWLDPK